MMYEISPITKINSLDFAMANMVSTTPVNVFTADQCIAALEQEIFTLHSTKKNFDGVEISQPAPKSAPKANKPAQTNTPKTPEGSEPSPKPKPTEPPKSMSAQPQVHPFADVCDAPYKPPHERNFAAAPKPAKDKEPTYQTLTPIQNSELTMEIYNKLMKSPLVTLFPEELFAISPDVWNQLREAITLKCIPTKTISANAFIEEVPDEETSITVPDVYETYLNNLAPGERAIPLDVTEESFTL
jgi:hypothetical protein